MENMDSGTQKECSDLNEGHVDDYVGFCHQLADSDAVQRGSFRVQNLLVKTITVNKKKINILTLLDVQTVDSKALYDLG